MEPRDEPRPKLFSFSIDDILKKPPSNLFTNRTSVSLGFEPMTREDVATDDVFGSVPVTPDSTTTSPKWSNYSLPKLFLHQKMGSTGSPLTSPSSPQPFFFPDSLALSPSAFQRQKPFSFFSMSTSNCVNPKMELGFAQNRAICKLIQHGSILASSERGFWNHRGQSKRKGGQIRFTTNQTGELEKTFRIHKYLSPSERRKLSHSLRLSERQVKTWFQNRRAKWRRLKQELNPSSSTMQDQNDHVSIIVD